MPSYRRLVAPLRNRGHVAFKQGLSNPAPELHGWLHWASEGQRPAHLYDLVKAMLGDGRWVVWSSGSLIPRNIRRASEADALAAVRAYLSYLPQNWSCMPPVVAARDPKPTDLRALVPESERQAFDMRRFVRGVVDEDSFFEIHALWARELEMAGCNERTSSSASKALYSSQARNVMHTASPSVVAMKLREHTPVGKLVTLHFPWRMCSWRFVQALVSVRIRMRSEQAVSRPCPNRVRRDAKSLGHLLLRQESLIAQSFIATLERIVILDEINDHLPCKQSPVAGAMPVLVEYRRNAAGRVRLQQRVDLGHDRGARLLQFPAR